MSADRTEKASPKRREDARKKGQIARRPELPAAAGFLASLAILEATGADWVARGQHLLAELAMRVSDPQPLTLSSVHGLLLESLGHFSLLVLPVTATLLITSLAGNFAQGGLTLSPEALTPKAERFNPAENWKRVFSPDRIVEFLKQMLVLGGIALACWNVCVQAVQSAASFVGLPAPQALLQSGTLLDKLGWRAGGVLLLLAGLDYGYGWYKHEKSLRMTKQELKDEYRQQEGDPMVKAQRRRAGRALSMRQIAQEVPRADVVVTNPTHFAVALKYDREHDAAPVVVAKGADLMAKRIRELAREHKVPVIENPPLARALYREVDARGVIPPEFFRAVAELLAFVYRQRGQTAP
jgi:flagellar biosynthetic protein FlhB